MSPTVTSADPSTSTGPATPASTVAVLGLGTMGRAFAQNLAAAGYAVQGYNRTPGSVGPDDLVRSSTDPREAVQGARVVLIMVSDAAATEALIAEVAPVLDADTVLVQMATIGVDGTRAVQRLLGDRPDVVFVDAPVSGTRGPAVAGTVTILASAPAALDRGRVDPIFSVIGARTVWLGEAGAGTRMKLALNAWLVAVMSGIAEAAAVARRLGIDYDTLAETLEGGPLSTPYALGKLKKMAAADYSPDMALKWASKDAHLALEAHRAAGGGSLVGLELIDAHWRALVEEGLGDDDLSIVHTRALTDAEAVA